MARRDIPRLDWLEGFDKVLIVRHEYPDNRIGFDLIVQDNGHPDVLTTVTTHLDFYGYKPHDGCFFIKNYSEHEGLGEALVRANVVEPTGRQVAYGPYDASADEYRFTLSYR